MSYKRSSINRPPTPDVDKDRENQEPTLQEIINIKFHVGISAFEFRDAECMAAHYATFFFIVYICIRAYTRKKGRSNVTVDDLVHVITPKGRASVPDSVKAELLQRIRSFLGSATT
ncbi:hypothetical protein JRO89_XS05G0119300 [Xanthoceras sorbifolium]|uniref:Transcription factor CBF/NF-Y/archaeal histone domain-containing protein n=1 Tax=Xanthoceras sorbifolium TaxID=99658 RepID=A0ABQ8I1Z4_9ROSI|nr:hypothetical protein JRO89_XS05G0119300 [Xanthoceras sorbifolium]